MVVGVCGVVIGFIFIFSLPKDLAKDEEKEDKEKERDGERAEDLTLRSVIKVSFSLQNALPEGDRFTCPRAPPSGSPTLTF